MPGLISSIVKRLRQVAFSFREKQPAQVDDYVLEHFLLYHGLVGSSPENQRSFRDVRQDIFQAVDNKSSLQLGIALKLAPLWWQDKLAAIFLEVKDRARALETLLPDLEDTTWPNNSDPLGHSDWRVRANAANLFSALEYSDADERMCRSLIDTTDNAKAAFCHVAYGLGRLATDRGMETLKALINAEEPWFRVDVAGALAASQREDQIPELAQALFSNHILQDYTAVAIARHRKPSQFLGDEREAVQDGGCMLIIGLLHASQQTFKSDVLDENEVFQSLPEVTQLVEAAPNPIRIRAFILLSQSTAENAGDRERFATQETAQMLRKYMAAGSSDDARAQCNSRQAIQLLGQLKVGAALPDLLDLLKNRTESLDLVIQALEDLGAGAAAAPLCALCASLVDVFERGNQPPSKQPVQEHNEADAKTYWQILKALGNLPSPDSVALLAKAANDFAPDKREQALTSFISVSQLDSSLPREPVIKAIENGLSDPSSGVRVSALKGAAQLYSPQLMALILACFDARELSVARQTQQTLHDLWVQGHDRVVEEALQTKLKRESDQFRRKKILDFLGSHKQG